MGRRGHLVGAGAAALAALWCATPVAGAAPRSAPAFAPIATVAPATDEPGALACARPSFCLEIAAGNEGLQFAPSTIVSHDAGQTWQRAAPLPPPVLPSGASGSLGFGFVVGTGSHGTLSFGGGIAGLSAQCTSPGICVAGGGASLARTTDGARSWSVRGGLPSRWSLGVNVTCLGDGACVAVGRYGHHLRSAWLGARRRRFSMVERAALPDGFSPRAIACPTSRRCLLAGTLGRSAGALLVAHHLGRSLRWELVASMRHRVLRSIACPSVSVCVGLLDNLGPRGQVRSVEVVRSTDGGIRWHAELRSPKGGIAPTEVDCTSVLDCATSVGPPPLSSGATSFAIYSSSGGAPPSTEVRTAYTTDGGEKWREHDVVAITVFDPPSGWGACLAPDSCVADGAGSSGGATQVMADGTWRTVSTNLGPTAMPSVACTTGSTCELVEELQGTTGYASRLLGSGDDGRTWSAVRLPAGAQPTQAAGCQGPTTCEVIAVVGVGLVDGQQGNYDYARSKVELLVTSDAGATWATSKLAGPGWVPTLGSCSSGTQCAVLLTSADGLLQALASTRNGTAWSRTPVPGSGGFAFGFGLGLTTPSLSCGTGGTCLFSDPSFIGLGTTLLRSSDGGATWIVATPPGPQGAYQVTGVSCTTAGDCSIVANPGTSAARLYSTTDGGATWSSPSEVPGGAFADQSNALALSCWTAGACVVLGLGDAEQTEDRGATWTHVAVPGSTQPLPLVLFGGPDELACGGPSTCALVLTQAGFGPAGVTASTGLFALEG